MSPRNVSTLTLVSALTIATAVVAQQPGAPFNPQAGQFSEPKTSVGFQPSAPVAIGGKTADFELLSRPGVAEELKITDAQKAKLGQIKLSRRTQEAEFRKSVYEANQRNFQLGAAPVNPNEARAEHDDAINAEADAVIAQFLTAKQRGRLAQIGLQMDGPLSLAREDVQAKLNLDAGQVEAIREILEQSGGASPGLIGLAPSAAPRARGTRPAPPKAADGAAKAEKAPKADASMSDPAMQQIARILRKKQLDAYNRLKGEPFEPKGADQPTVSTATAVEAEGDAAKPAPNAAAKPAAPKTPSRKSLRERRGSSSGG